MTTPTRPWANGAVLGWPSAMSSSEEEKTECPEYSMCFPWSHFPCNIEALTDRVTRVVFGEARGEPYLGQLAVAYTIVNRVGHAGFPNNITAVLSQKAGAKHQYETLDLPEHTANYNAAKASNSDEYKNCTQAAQSALCRTEPDPTGCAVNFCAVDPCAATDSNDWWTAVNKMKIGNHYFICLVPK
ncbi:hypothetical protein FSP39_005835 [Pinctada imbricata]|uniref:Cell wall hydrolase SleB domain-containing protein n=1 Tax=Pinctada imbricata TaxID=66713 RepID=A0AA89BVG1_PINIB|nr:hypothetical protein FSP39_005835 [Pinctada imbricata]